jgi:hypothetical protein
VHVALTRPRAMAVTAGRDPRQPTGPSNRIAPASLQAVPPMPPHRRPERPGGKMMP